VWSTLLAATVLAEDPVADFATLGGFGALDWAVVLGFLVLTTWIGHRMSGSQASMRDFFLGGRRLPWYAVSASIIATEISAVTFISLPSVVAKPGGDFTYLQLGLVGGLIARAVVAYVLVPAYYKREIYSPYDFMAARFGEGSRKVVTALFALGGVLGQAARVYLTALVLEVLLGPELAAVERWTGLSPLVASVSAVALVAVAWTWMGGIAAVVWTDAVLFLVFLAGIVITIATVAGHYDGGVAEIARQGWEAGKFRLWNFDTSLTENYTLWTALIGVAVWNVGQYGTDQLMAQRFFCCAGPREARKAVLAAYAAMGVTVLVGFVGVSLWAWYQAHPMEGAALALYTDSPDRIFPIYLVQQVPAGLRGLVMAGVFATAISSLDSIMAALSQTTLSAFVLPRRERELERRRAAGEAVDEAAEARRTLKLSRKLVVVFAVLLSVVAVGMDWVAAHYHSILDLALAMATYTAGGLLAGFALAFFRLKIDGRGYFWSAPLSVLTVFALAWHQDLAQEITMGAAILLLVSWVVLRTRPALERGLSSRDVVGLLGLALCLLILVWVSRHGTLATYDPAGKLLAGRAKLSFVWYPLIGTCVAFFFGWLLSNPASPEPEPQT
jgi:Na+/proline symporter